MAIRLLRDISASTVTAGVVAVLVTFTSTAVIIFQAARVAGATPEQAGSWIWALCVPGGILTVALSLRTRMPIVVSWSTPAAALLVTSTSGLPLSQYVGAFVVAGALTALVGATGVFARIVDRIPVTIAAALLAGILLRFGLDAFASIQARPALVLAMIGAFLASRLWLPRYAVLLALVVGVAIAWADGTMGHVALPDGPTSPAWVTPHLSVAAVVGVALPLLLVSLASQTLPGVAVLRADGYDPPVSTVIAATGLTTVVSAPFGAFSHSLVAITAAMCTGREAHPDPARRYTAAITAGMLALVVGIFGGAVAGFFAAFPHELVAAIAGLALLGAIANGLAVAVRDERDREAALVTFLVTASGVTIHAVGSAFWGLVAGAVVLGLRAVHARTVSAARA